MDGCIRTRWLCSISSTQIWLWLLPNFKVCGVRQNLCVQPLPQPWPWWPDFWVFTSIQWMPCRLRTSVPLFGLWVIWMSIRSGGFYDHEPSWSYSLWLRNCLQCDLLVVGPTLASGGTLDLLMTDVPDPVRVAVVEPISNWDHYSLSAVISMTQAVPNLFVNRKVFLKNKLIGMLSMVLQGICPGITFGLLTILLRFRTNVCPSWLDVMNQPRASVYVTKMSLGLMINAGMLKQEAHLRWTRDRSRVNWEEFFLCQVRANETYSEAKHPFSDRDRDVLMNVYSANKWWSTLMSAVHLHSLVRVVDWCVSRLVRLICCRIILTASSPGRLLICRWLAIHLQALSHLHSCRVR